MRAIRYAHTRKIASQKIGSTLEGMIKTVPIAMANLNRDRPKINFQSISFPRQVRVQDAARIVLLRGNRPAERSERQKCYKFVIICNERASLEHFVPGIREG